jgi:hypothetical protein
MALATPLDITTPTLWLDHSDASTLYDAASGGALVAADGDVARINDKSGNANHAVFSGGKATRKTAIQNSLDILRFDGADYYRGTANATTGDTKTVIALAKSANATGGSIWCSRNTGRCFLARTLRSGSSFISGDVTATNVTTTLDITTPMQSFFLQVWRSPSSLAIEYRANGTAQSTSGTILSDTGTTGYCLATLSSSFQNWTGDIAELIVVNSYVTTAVAESLEGYMAHKWGLSSLLPSDHPYKSAAPTTGSADSRRRRQSVSGGVL